MVFGVDFDGTLSFGQWPGCGPANDGLFAFLKERKANGDKLILWTCREGEDLRAAVEWCLNLGLEFDAINDNLPHMKEFFGNNPRKIFCNEYIDNINFGGIEYILQEIKKQKEGDKNE